MKQKIFTLILTTVLAISATPLTAKNSPKQAINVCAIAIPLYNYYIINYEYLFQQRHGLATRLEYALLSGTGIADSKGMAAVLNYRWHFSPKLESFFLGAQGRYRYVDGSGSADGTKFDFEVPEWNIGLSAGYRWIHDATGINIVFSLGYGHSWVTEKINPANDNINSTFREFKKDNDSYLDAPFFGEFSIGYAF